MNQHLPYRVFIAVVLVVLPFYARSQIKAGFSASPTSDCSPLVVNFQDRSSGQPVKYFWKFGNGNTSAKKDPGAVYYRPGSYTVTLIVEDANGNKDTLTRTDLIKVFANPEAEFSVDKTDGCLPLTVNFQDNTKKGSAGIKKYSWDFGDGTVSNQKHPSHRYARSGNFTVSLVVEDSNGCSDNILKKSIFKLSKTPKVDFSASDSIGCNMPFKVNFREKAKSYVGGGLNYKWQFGDNTNSSDADPSKTYNAKGQYNVSLTVTDRKGCQSSLTKKSYIIIRLEKADFTVSPKKGCTPMNVEFTNTSSPKVPGSDYTWYFGDGKQSQKKNARHTYDKTGQYTVKLVVESSNGCVDSVVKQDVVRVFPGTALKFSTPDTFSCDPPLNSKFKVSGDTGKVQSWYWNFGDGNTGVTQEPTHTYRRQGEFDITLRAIDVNSCTTQVKKTEYVKVKKPDARIGLDVRKGCKPLKVRFNDKSGSPDPIVLRKWYFDDGDTGWGKKVSHTYKNEGIYFPELLIKTQRGCTDTVRFKSIKVGIPPQTDFYASNREGCLSELDVQFFNQTNDHSPRADSFFWSFGDGNTSKVMNPSHEYDHPPDTLDVTLFAWFRGCPDTLVKTDYITIKPPWAGFLHIAKPCNRDTIEFQNHSVGDDSLKWDFGDGSVSYKDNPVHHYDPVGGYKVVLTVWNDSTGCKDTAAKFIGVKRPFDANFTQSVQEGCYPLKVRFEGKVNDSAVIRWDFGNGQTSRKLKEVVEYRKPGNYTVKFTAVPKSKCNKKFVKTRTVSVWGTEVNMNISPSRGCAPLKVTAVSSINASNWIREKYWETGDGKRIDHKSDTLVYLYGSPPPVQKDGYPLHLVVKDFKGCNDTAKATVKVTHPVPELDRDIEPLCDSVKITFKPKLGDSNVFKPAKVRWDFGNGQKYNTKKVVKKLKRENTYQITMTVTDGLGCKDSLVKTLHFSDPELKAGFAADSTYGPCPPLSVNFTDTSHARYAPIEYWKWSFGDGSFSYKQEPRKIYLLPGRYTVTLKVRDSVGCVDTFVGPDFVVVDGPTGSYKVDPVSGCMPLEVNFDATTQNTSEVRWDLGDGNVVRGEDTRHIYRRPAEFVPLLILSDDRGCTYALPPEDTVRVKPLPLADFTLGNKCFGYPAHFRDSSLPVKGRLQSWYWDFGDGDTTSGPRPDHIYHSPGFYRVMLVVRNSGNCLDTVSHKVKIGGLDARFSVKDSTACQITPVQFYDETFADTVIDWWKWKFGDGDSARRRDPVKKYENKGIYDVQLVVEDVAGCRDTLLSPEYMKVGDTLPPVAPPVYRATVIGNHGILLEYQKYHDFDLEKYLIYRKKPGSSFKLAGTASSVEDTVFIDKNLNTLQNSYCYKLRVESFCHRYSDLDSSRTHCTVELEANPDTNSALLSWNFYRGWDSVLRYEIYREKTGDPGSLVRIGSVPGDSAFFVDTGIICYQEHFYKIKALETGGFDQRSWSDSSGTKPVYVPHVPSNKIIRATVLDNRYALLDWKKPQNVNVKRYLVEKSKDGNQYRLLNRWITGEDNSFVDHAVNVQKQDYFYRMRVMDSCGDTGGYSNTGKTILLKVRLDEKYRPVLNWTRYRKWASGVGRYDIELMQSNGRFGKIAMTGHEDTVFTDTLTGLNSLSRYRYRIIARRKDDPSVISVSNEDVADGESKIYIPNSFTPNGDDLNDIFKPRSVYLESYNLKVFNRWGDKLFETNNINEGWDGTSLGKPCQEDVYIYLVQAVGIDSKHYQLDGDVTLLR